MLICRHDLGDLLPLRAARAAVGAYWRNVARTTTEAHGAIGFRFARRGEHLHGRRAEHGEWIAYRPATSGRYGRSADWASVPGPGSGVSVADIDLAAIRTHADVLVARTTIDHGPGDYHAARISGVWTVTVGRYHSADRSPRTAYWSDGSRLRAGVVGRGTHAPNPAVWREMRADRARSIRARRRRIRDLDSQWVTPDALRAAGACDLGIRAAWPRVRAAAGLPSETPLEAIGGIRADVVHGIFPHWSHATARAAR